MEAIMDIKQVKEGIKEAKERASKIKVYL